MSGFENDVVYAKNADFTQADNQAVSENNGLITNGQLWIGRTGVNAGGTHIDVNTLTAGTGISITNGPGTITVASTGALVDLHTARYIVSAGGASDGANYTTITAAIAAAAGAGGVQTVYIQPGVYTENLTAITSINLCACGSDGVVSGQGVTIVPNVIIKGTISASFTGCVTLFGIQLLTNGATCISTSGALAGNIILNSCSVYAFNATGITLNSSTTALNCYNCQFNSASTNLLLTQTLGSTDFECCNFALGASSAASTVASGNINFNACNMQGLKITTSSGGTIVASSCYWQFAGNTLLTTAGTGTSYIWNTYMASTSSTPISVGSGTTVICMNSELNTSNVAAISGAGTFQYGGLVFPGTGSNITTTTSTPFGTSDVTGATQAISVNNTYVANRGGGVTFTLPASAGEGEWFEIVGKAGLWVLAQNANQSIGLSSSTTTVGITGSLTATNAGDCIRLRCTTAGASSVWRVVSSMGNITVA